MFSLRTFKMKLKKYILAEMQATDTLEKQDIRKKAAEAKEKRWISCNVTCLNEDKRFKMKRRLK